MRGLLQLSTNPVADKTARGYNHVGIYTANQAGTYITLGVLLLRMKPIKILHSWCQVFDGTTYGTSYTKVVYALPHMATLQGDRLFDKLSFPMSDPISTLCEANSHGILMSANTSKSDSPTVARSLGLEMLIYVNVDTVPITDGMIVSTAAAHSPAIARVLSARTLLIFTSYTSIVGYGNWCRHRNLINSGRVLLKGVIHGLNTGVIPRRLTAMGVTLPCGGGGMDRDEARKGHYAVQIGSGSRCE